MANPELSRHIQALPDELNALEGGREISERLRRIDALKDRARSLEPLDGVEDMALADYDRDWLVRYTYNSNAIEGSTLTLEDTSLVLEGEFVPSDSPARYVFAARGVADGMAYVREYAKEGRKLNEELIRRLHEVTALDLQPFARGTFRPYGYLARITATRVKTADPLEIRDDLQVLVDVLNGSGAHPLLKAAGFHAMFENIHPFMDGNGRTGRQLLNFMLLKHGYRPVAIKYDAKRDYARGLEAWQVDGDSAAFCSVFLDCVEQEEQSFIELVEGLRRARTPTIPSITRPTWLIDSVNRCGQGLPRIARVMSMPYQRRMSVVRPCEDWFKEGAPCLKRAFPRRRKSKRGALPPAAGPKPNWPNGACRGLRRKAGGKSSSANGKNSRHTLRNFRNSASRCLCQMEWSKETCSDLPCGLRSRCGALVAYMWRHSTVRVDTRRQ